MLKSGASSSLGPSFLSSAPMGFLWQQCEWCGSCGSGGVSSAVSAQGATVILMELTPTPLKPTPAGFHMLMSAADPTPKFLAPPRALWIR